VLAASAAGAMVVSDPMVDPRGGAFTLGLGLLPRVAVVPQVEQWSADRLHRTLDLADSDTGLLLLTLASGAAALRNGDGTWTAHGRVGVYRGHAPVDLDELAATTR
jgi:cyanophycinase